MHCETRLCDPEYPEDPIRSSSEHAARKKPVWSLTPADGRRGSIAINLGLMQVKHTGDSQVALTELADVFHVGQETTSVVLVTFEVWGLTEMGENYTSSKVGWRVGLVLGKKKGSNSHVTFEMLLGIQMKH